MPLFEREHCYKMFGANFNFIAVFLMLIVLHACSNLSVKAPSNHDLAGVWVINSTLSDNYDAQAWSKGLSRAQNQKRKGRDQRGSRGPTKTKGRSWDLEIPVMTTALMKIKLSDDFVEVIYDSTTIRDLVWGKNKQGNGQVEVGWKNHNLIFITTGDQVDIEETLVLSSDHRVLTVFVEIKANRIVVKLKRVFERQSLRD